MSILILDVGTSSMRGSLFRENGSRIHSVQIKYRPVYEKNGWVTQQAADWGNALYRIVSSLVQRAETLPEPIDALAFTSQRSSVLPVDAEGNALMDAVMWQDTRNKEICTRLRLNDDLLFQKSGATVNTVLSGSKMTWIRENCPDVYSKTYKFLTVADYLLYLMTGVFHTDVTYGSRSGLMNLETRAWDTDLLRLYNVEENRLCKLHEPGDISGAVTKTFAEITGLQEGIPVISAGGDQQCAAVGQGAYKSGTLSIVAGTGGFLAAAKPKVPANLTKEVVCSCSSVPGHYLLEANVLTCCAAFDWFCRNFYYSEIAGEIDYHLVNKELEMCKDVSSAMVLPYFRGKGTPKWNPDAKAVFYNITLSTDRKELLKGLVEGICMEIDNNISSLKKYVALDQICISGGLTQSPTICQMQADVYGLSLYKNEDCETTSLGALMVAGTTLGLFRDFDHAYEQLHTGENRIEYKPNAQKRNQYIEKKEEMNALYHKIYESAN